MSRPARPAEQPIDPKGTRTGDRSGFVLIIALVLLGLMATWATHLHVSTRQARTSAHQQAVRARLRAALVDEAFNRLDALAADPQPLFDHRDKYWLGTREVDRPEGLATKSQLTDLNQYLDLNNLWLPPDFPGQNITERVLQEVLVLSGDDAPLERIVPLTAWMQPTEERDAALDFYAAADPPYSAPGTALLAWGEFQWIRGFEPGYWQPRPRTQVARPFEFNVIDLVTILPGPRTRPVPVNINTAPLPLLEALFGPGHESAARYVALNREERPLRAIDPLEWLLPEPLFQRLRPFITVRSSYVRLDAQAYLDGQYLSLYVLAERDTDGSVHIRHWSWRG